MPVASKKCVLCPEYFTPLTSASEFCPTCQIKNIIRNTPVDQINNLEKGPDGFLSSRVRDGIVQYGSAEQLKELQRLIKDAEQKGTLKIGAIVKAPEQKIPQKTKSVMKPVDKSRAKEFILKKIGYYQTLPPAELTVDIGKEIMWDFMRRIIYSENPNAEIIMDDDLKEMLPRFVKWLLGDYTGKYSPRKSLYIYGDLGTGKSTVAMAAFYMMQYFKVQHKWAARSFEFKSMDEVWMKLYTDKNFDAIKGMEAGNWCIDEIRVEHMELNSWGTKINVVNDLLAVRHLRWRMGQTTIITSNIDPELLEEELKDSRLYQRMLLEYEFIELNGDNKRAAEEKRRKLQIIEE